MSGVLRIFPAYGLDNSLLTAVLIGLYIRFFFTEWLGWVFSGLVVPGYLAAIVILRPLSAFVIGVEAILTFALVRGLSHFLSRSKLGTPVFGRDRFMWLVVTSVGIRVLIEAVLAPPLEGFLRARYGWDLSDSFGLYGIGLVLVPLLANACWKPGLVRGGLQQLVCTGITYFALQWLQTRTNLSFSDVALSFEKIAVDIAASPKAYLLLLAGALIASRANLRFGWDTSGVVIPGLLCLGWFAPVRLISTVCEAILIAFSASLFVRLPGVRDWNVEGPRRVVLTFTIGYVIKFVFVAAFGAAMPGFTATDLFGLGYLLPSLLAVKIWQRRDPTHALMPAVGLSFAGLLLGSIVGYGLVVADTAVQSHLSIGRLHAQDQRCGGDVALLSEVRLARARSARTRPNPAAPRIRAPELATLDGMLHRLRAATERGAVDCAELAAQVRPGELGLLLHAATSPNGRSFFTLREATEEPDQLRGFGLLAVAARTQGGPVLVVEKPQRDLLDLDALVVLAERLGADAIVLNGLPGPELGRGNIHTDRDVPLRTALSALGGTALVIRTDDVERPRLSALLPAALVHALEAELGRVERSWIGRTAGELVLPLRSAQALSQSLVPQPRRFPSTAGWSAALASMPARSSVPPSPAAALLLAEEVVRPLARARVPIDLPALARGVAGAASELGYEVVLIDGPQPHIGLLGRDEGLLLAPGAPAGAFVQAASRRLGIAELALAIFERHGGHALLAPAPGPGAWDSGPLARVAAPILALTPPPADVIMVHSGPTSPPTCALVSDALRSAEFPPLVTGLERTLDALGVRCERHTQYDPASTDPPSQGVDLLRMRTSGEFVTLHVSPELRERFRQAPPFSTVQQALFMRLEIPIARVSLEQQLIAACSEPAPQLAAMLPAELLRDAREFVGTRHPALLERLRDGAKASRVEVKAVDDEGHGEAYVLIRWRRGAAALSLRPSATDSQTLPCDGDVAEGTRKAQLAGAKLITTGAP